MLSFAGAEKPKPEPDQGFIENPTCASFSLQINKKASRIIGGQRQI
jgi:hypothetical protein